MLSLTAEDYLFAKMWLRVLMPFAAIVKQLFWEGFAPFLPKPCRLLGHHSLLSNILQGECKKTAFRNGNLASMLASHCASASLFFFYPTKRRAEWSTKSVFFMPTILLLLLRFTPQTTNFNILLIHSKFESVFFGHHIICLVANCTTHNQL